MKKLLVFIMLWSLFSCNKESQDVQPDMTGGNFALSLYSTDSVYQAGIDSLFLFYFPESTSPVKPTFSLQKLAWGQPIEIRDLKPEPYTFITVACPGSLEELEYRLGFYRTYVSIDRYPNTSGNLFGGVLKQNPVSGEVKFELQRLVGGIKINIAGSDTLTSPMSFIECVINNVANSVYLGETDMTPDYSRENIPTDNSWYYIFPTEGPVKGTIEITSYDENSNQINRIFEFTAENAVEANKKLELNFTLQQKVRTKGAANEWQLSLEEKVIGL